MTYQVGDLFHHKTDINLVLEITGISNNPAFKTLYDTKIIKPHKLENDKRFFLTHEDLDRYYTKLGEDEEML
jgi:hypothetical protein